MQFYKPQEFQATNKSMIRFKGRCALKQYLPNKPIKREYKIWVRANQSGYFSEFKIYTGKKFTGVEKNLGQAVVLDLSRNLSGKYYKVFFNNHFSSIEKKNTFGQKNIRICDGNESKKIYIY